MKNKYIIFQFILGIYIYTFTIWLLILYDYMTRVMAQLWHAYYHYRSKNKRTCNEFKSRNDQKLETYICKKYMCSVTNV